MEPTDFATGPLIFHDKCPFLNQIWSSQIFTIFSISAVSGIQNGVSIHIDYSDYRVQLVLVDTDSNINILSYL